jgi:hypothetical protein
MLFVHGCISQEPEAILTESLQIPLEISSQGIYELQQSGFRGIFDSLHTDEYFRRAVQKN